MNIGALIVWLLAMASGAAVFILTPDVWTLALAAGIVLVPLAGMTGAFAARKAVAVEVILPRGAEKGRDAVIAFRGTNGAWLPLPRVEFRFVMTNGLTGETRRETVRPLRRARSPRGRLPSLRQRPCLRRACSPSPRRCACCS